jgi:hydroxymethylglutaryl-CoA synthase
VLVVATDEAVYDLASPGEPTQGAGACAVLVSDQPKLVTFGEAWYADTRDVNDFWRPPERRTALVDGRLSVATYLDALKACRAQLPHGPGTWSRALFHLPFTRMAAKAARVLDLPQLAWDAGTVYGRLIGNVYTASLYVSLASLLENDEADLAETTVGAFAYGSGATGILHELSVCAGYRDHLRTEQHRQMIADRTKITIDDYEAWRQLPHQGEAVADPGDVSQPPIVRFAGIEGWARQYRFTAVKVEPDLIEELPKGRGARTSDQRETH